MFKHRFCQYTLLALVSLASWANPVVPPINATAGSDVVVNFNGIGGTPVVVQPGLSSSVRFYNFTFTAGQNGVQVGNDTYDFSGLTNVQFDMDITNTSSAPITASRVTAVGFLTTPEIAKSLNSTNVNQQGKSEGTIDPNSVTNTFTNVDYGSNFPNGLGNVEFCFSDSNNCPGGANGGVAMGGTGTAKASLWFTGNSLTSLRFDNLFVRYQSVAGCATCGGSATGRPVLPPGSDPVVPEPSFYGLLSLGMGGLLWFSYRRRQQA
jgi:hypothetical protein